MKLQAQWVATAMLMVFAWVYLVHHPQGGARKGVQLGMAAPDRAASPAATILVTTALVAGVLGRLAFLWWGNAAPHSISQQPEDTKYSYRYTWRSKQSARTTKGVPSTLLADAQPSVSAGITRRRQSAPGYSSSQAHVPGLAALAAAGCSQASALARPQQPEQQHISFSELAPAKRMDASELLGAPNPRALLLMQAAQLPPPPLAPPQRLLARRSQGSGAAKVGAQRSSLSVPAPDAIWEDVQASTSTERNMQTVTVLPHLRHRARRVHHSSGSHVYSSSSGSRELGAHSSMQGGSTPSLASGSKEGWAPHSARLSLDVADLELLNRLSTPAGGPSCSGSCAIPLLSGPLDSKLGPAAHLFDVHSIRGGAPDGHASVVEGRRESSGGGAEDQQLMRTLDLDPGIEDEWGDGPGVAGSQRGSGDATDPAGAWVSAMSKPGGERRLGTCCATRRMRWRCTTGGCQTA